MELNLVRLQDKINVRNILGEILCGVIELPGDYYPRINFKKGETFETISYSWMQLDLEQYLGCASTLDKHPKRIYFFRCKKFGQIFVHEYHLNSLIESTIRHGEYKIANLFKIALKDKEEIDAKVKVLES